MPTRGRTSIQTVTEKAGRVQTDSTNRSGRQIDGFGQMDRRSARRLDDLLAAAEPVGDDEGILRRTAHRWKQDPLANGLRNKELVSAEAKRTSHPATAGVDRLQISAHFAEQ